MRNKRLADRESAAKATEENLKRSIEDAENRAKDADLNVRKAIEEKERLLVENKGLRGTVQERDGRIQVLLDDVKKYRTEAIAQEINAKQAQERNEKPAHSSSRKAATPTPASARTAWAAITI